MKDHSRLHRRNGKTLNTSTKANDDTHIQTKTPNIALNKSSGCNSGLDNFASKKQQLRVLVDQQAEERAIGDEFRLLHNAHRLAFACHHNLLVKQQDQLEA